MASTNANGQDVREPLLPVRDLNSQEPGIQTTPFVSKGSHVYRQRGTISRRHSARSIDSDEKSVGGFVPGSEDFVFRGSTIEATVSFPDPMAEDNNILEVAKQNRSVAEGTKEIGADQTSSSNYQEDNDVTKDEESGSERSLEELKLEAMTWAAMAKDSRVSSLEKRLRVALEIAKAEQERNLELERLLRERKEQQEATAKELQSAKEQISKLVEAEERLCVQLGNAEAEAVDEDRRYRSQIATLTERVKAQDHFIAHSLKKLKEGRPVEVYVKNESAKLKAGVSTAQLMEQSLSTKLDLAMNEMEGLRGDLNDVKTDLRVSEEVRRNQSRKLKVLEKERRYLMKKGAIRSVRLAPRFPKKTADEVPGGEGWKVFSILDFES